MTKALLAGALALAAACAGVARGAAASAAPLPMAGWSAAFDHLLELSGARDAPALCVSVQDMSATGMKPAEVLAGLRSPVPVYDAGRCGADSGTAAPDGGEAWRLDLWVAQRRHGEWSLNMSYMAGPLYGAGFVCTLGRARGAWQVTACRRNFTS